MARITVEDCLKKVNNRFSLIHMASKRVRQLRKGMEPSITSKNRDIVISLREIAAGNITEAEFKNDENVAVEDTSDILTEELDEKEPTEPLEKEQNEETEPESA